MMKEQYFRYGKKEIDFLSSRDKKIGEVIRRTGKIKRKVNPDLFSSLTDCIVSQQISKAAAITVSRRLREATGGIISPEKISKLGEKKIQLCGMSMKKAQNIHYAANSILNGKISLHEFPSMADEAIIDQLVQLPGIGKWTAEMLMLFSLQRPDILSYDDLIIRRSVMKLHGFEKISKKEFEGIRKLYSPYGSVASLYLWSYGHEA